MEIEFHTTLNDAVGEKNLSRRFDTVAIDGEPLPEPGRESRTIAVDTTIALSAGFADGSMPIARRFA